MDLKDMILVIENDRGTETNMLMTLDDYKSFIAIDDMSELADNLLQLGRTLGKPTKDNTTIGVSWEHGIYLGSTLSTTNFKAYKREYGTPEKIEDIYDYRAKLKQKFYFYQDMSKDDDVPKKLQNDFLHQMYEDFGTIEEDCFYDRLEDGKYDEGFKERQVKEEKSR